MDKFRTVQVVLAIECCSHAACWARWCWNKSSLQVSLSPLLCFKHSLELWRERSFPSVFKIKCFSSSVAVPISLRKAQAFSSCFITSKCLHITLQQMLTTKNPYSITMRHVSYTELCIFAFLDGMSATRNPLKGLQNVKKKRSSRIPLLTLMSSQTKFISPESELERNSSIREKYDNSPSHLQLRHCSRRDTESAFSTFCNTLIWKFLLSREEMWLLTTSDFHDAVHFKMFLHCWINCIKALYWCK